MKRFLRSLLAASVLPAAAGAAQPDPGPNLLAEAPPPSRELRDSGVDRAPGRDKKTGPFGPVRLGPLIGTGLPDLFNLGVTLKYKRHLGAGFNMGLIPTLTVPYYGDATLSYREYDVYGRVYPFGTGFFLNAGLGYQTASATYSTTVDGSAYAREAARLGLPSSVDYRGEGSVRSLIFVPAFGYLHTFGSGFSAGLDLGVRLPLSTSEVGFSREISEDIPASLMNQYVAPNEQSARDTLEKVARTPIPAFGVHVGWLF